MFLRLAACLFFWKIATFAAGQTPFDIPFFEPKITLDGRADEWKNQPFHSFFCPAPNGHADSVAFSLAWNEEFLLGFARISDDCLARIETGHGNPRLYFNDGIELYLDTRANAADRMDSDDFQFILDLAGEMTAFRGGDKLAIFQESTVPKDTMTGLALLEMATRLHGSLNQLADRDDGFDLEFRIPWANLGLKPRPGLPLGLDFCHNDLDTLVPDLRAVDTLAFFTRSFTGWQDYGFPKKWQSARLVGQPGWARRFSKKHLDGAAGAWLLAGLLAVLMVAAWLGWQNWRLRNTPRRLDLEANPGLLRAVGPVVFQEKMADSPPPPLPEKLETARLFILQNLDRDFAMDELARHLTMSLRSMQRFFRETVDATPGQFVQLVRLESAAAMLREGSRTVSEVAWACGFSDAAYFGRVFKKYFNELPSAVRR